MKIISKTYLLVTVLIILAIIDLGILLTVEQKGTAESYTLIRAGDLKVKAETIAGLAISVASGNEADRSHLKDEIHDFENVLSTLQSGGSIRGQSVVTIPNSLDDLSDDVEKYWNHYERSASTIQETSVFDPEVTNALNYVLDNSDELILLTNSAEKEIASLDRNYNRHKEIILDMQNHVADFAQQVLLISIGEEETAREELQKARIIFEIDIKKLVGESTTGYEIFDEEHQPEDLISLPRDSSNSLRQLEPLWDSIRLRMLTLEEKSLLSPEFQAARNEIDSKKMALLSSIDELLDAWNAEINQNKGSQQSIVFSIIGVDVIVFIVVIFVIRKSLNPLEIITRGLSQVREGVYGKKIDYKADDEVGQLVESFNIMSDTIKQKEDEARKTDIAKDEFLAMITHELKTPLVPIQGYSDLLLSEHLGKLTPKQKERVSIIKSSATTLLDIISDLLDAQKLELGQLRLKKENVSIKKTIQSSIDALKPQAEEWKRKMVLKCPNIIISHDPEKINQVLTNLIKNSLYAVKEKSGVVNIEVQDSPSEVTVNVIDNGIGIPIQKQGELFKKFYQVDSSLTRERGGSGLGLAICKGIVELHNGKIWVKSAPDEGSTFTFTIPKQSPDSPI